jgi:hypothetical protein
MALCKQEDFAKWYFLLFLFYILIFLAQKGWYIELNLMLSSDAVCVQVHNGVCYVRSYVWGGGGAGGGAHPP